VCSPRSRTRRGARLYPRALALKWPLFRRHVDRSTVPIATEAAEAISIVSIASGAVVAIVVPLISARREDARSQREANDARLDELRDVLEAAGLALTDAIDALRAAKHTRFTGEIEGLVPADPDASRSRARLELQTSKQNLELLRTAENRLSIRLGDGHQLTDTYTAAREALDIAYRTLASIAGRGKSSGRVAQVNKAEYLAERAKKAYFEAASQVVGPHVPLPADTRIREEVRKLQVEAFGDLLPPRPPEQGYLHPSLAPKPQRKRSPNR